MRTIQQPSNDVPVSGSGGSGDVNSLMSQPDYQEQHCGQQAHMVQVQHRPAPVWTTRQQQEQQQVHCTVYDAGENHYVQPTTTCSLNAAAAATTNSHQLISYANDQFGSNSDGYSPSTSQHIDEDELTASFGPDSEETDACEIEPSIGFASGIDELLFSEFIDLQDVPMNVDESDWLKKFLPPCSMG